MSLCLIDYIGLSQKDCNCPAFASNPSSTSASGYFVDDELSIEPLVYSDCGEGTVWEVLEQARTKAMIDLESDFNAELQKVYKQRTAPFVGEIGTKAYAGINTQAKAICGLRIDSKGVKGTGLYIGKVTIGNNLGGATVLKVWKGYSQNNVSVLNTELVSSQNITLLVNQFTEITLTTPISAEMKHGEHYFITYELPIGSFPFSNSLPSCGGCTGTNTEWRDSLQVNGFSVATDAEINATGVSANAQGIIINTKVYCDVSNWFCKLKSLGTASAEFKTVAKALSYRAAQNAVQKMLDSNQVNFTTLTSREALYGKRNHFQKEYNDRLTWLSSVFPISQFNCLTCGTKNAFSVNSILI